MGRSRRRTLVPRLDILEGQEGDCEDKDFVTSFRNCKLDAVQSRCDIPAPQLVDNVLVGVTGQNRVEGGNETEVSSSV
jgi:hypothetical protein